MSLNKAQALKNPILRWKYSSFTYYKEEHLYSGSTNVNCEIGPEIVKQKLGETDWDLSMMLIMSIQYS